MNMPVLDSAYIARREAAGLNMRLRQFIAPLAAVALLAHGPHLVEDELNLDLEVPVLIQHAPTTETTHHEQSRTGVMQGDKELTGPEILGALTFDTDQGDEDSTERFIEAVKEIVDPETDILVETSEPSTIEIRTGDFAEFPELEPKKDQTAKVVIGVDAALVKGYRTDSYTSTIPGYTTEGTKHEPIDIPYEYIEMGDEAVLPEKPKLLQRIRKIWRTSRAIELDTPTDTIAPEELEEAFLTPEPDTPRPKAPERPTDPTPPAIPEVVIPPEAPKPDRAIGGGGGLAGGTDRLGFPTAIDPPMFERPDLSVSMPDIHLPSHDIEWLKGLGSLILVGTAVFGWYKADFRSDSTCALPDTSGPLNIEKNGDSWLPTFERAECPTPDGKVLTITFGGFEDGYGVGNLTRDSAIEPTGRLSSDLIPDIIERQQADSEFTGAVVPLIEAVDKARAAAAQAASGTYNPMSFDTPRPN